MFFPYMWEVEASVGEQIAQKNINMREKILTAKTGALNHLNIQLFLKKV